MRSLRVTRWSDSWGDPGGKDEDDDNGGWKPPVCDDGRREGHIESADELGANLHRPRCCLSTRRLSPSLRKSLPKDRQSSSPPRLSLSLQSSRRLRLL